MRSSVLAGVQPRHFNQIRMDAVESAMFLPCLGNGGAFNFIQLTVFYFKGSKGSSGNNDKKNSTNDLLLLVMMVKMVMKMVATIRSIADRPRIQPCVAGEASTASSVVTLIFAYDSLGVKNGSTTSRIGWRREKSYDKKTKRLGM